jgi:RNA polymerase-binding transcription factor DksA
MTLTLHKTETVADEPLELLRSMIEEQFVLQTNRLTDLTIHRRLPGHGGYDSHTLELLAAAARQGIADTAHALQRMSEGTYGACENCGRAIPLGRLRAVPHARYCTRCLRHHRD